MVLLPTACKTEGEELAVWLEITAADGKSLSDTTIESSPQGEVIEITIASNTAWRISTSAEWIVPQQSSGEGSQGVMLDVGTTTQSRSGVVVVQLAEAEQVRRSFNIVQHAEGPEGPEDNEGAGDNGGSEGSGDNEGSSDSGNENGSEDEGGSDDIVMTPDGTDDEGGSDGSSNEGSTDNEDGTDNDGSNDGNTDDPDSSPDDDIVMTPDDPSDSGDTDDSEGNGNTDNGESKEDDAEDSDSGNDSNGTEDSDDKEDSEDNNDPNNPDNNQGDNEGNGNGDNNNNNEDNGGEGGNGNGNENNNGNDTPAGDYTLIDHVGELAAGEYFIGGYQDDVLHLATEGMTVGHCNTTPYTLSADFSLTPAADATATPIHLEPSNEANGYYIRFSTQGYLTATAAGAGKLTFSNSRSHFWRFANHPDGGFILTQSGDIDVKLIISPHARINALLRSVAGEEDGNAVLLFKRNNP